MPRAPRTQRQFINERPHLFAGGFSPLSGGSSTRRLALIFNVTSACPLFSLGPCLTFSQLLSEKFCSFFLSLSLQQNIYSMLPSSSSFLHNKRNRYLRGWFRVGYLYEKSLNSVFSFCFERAREKELASAIEL